MDVGNNGGVDQNQNNQNNVDDNANPVRVRVPRRCSDCGLIGFHDSRNCPEKRKEMIRQMENQLNQNNNFIGTTTQNHEQASSSYLSDVDHHVSDDNGQPIDTTNQIENQQHEVIINDEGNVSNDITNNEAMGESFVGFSSDGRTYWMPNVPDEIRPRVRAEFPSYEHVKAMYFFYAVESGFDVRKSTQKKEDGFVTLKYFVCNRQGDPNVSAQDTMDSNCRLKKRVDMHRGGCQAGMKCRILPGTCLFEIYDVEEKHNHPLYSLEIRHLSKTKRQLDFLQKAFIFHMSSQNIGSTKSYRLYSGLHGGYTNTGGNLVDFKNFARDLNCHVGGTDAKDLVSRMVGRSKHRENFSFEYQHDKYKLTSMFWADETAKLHYKEFGDVISFDATYRTNRYNMVLVPFTGVDNHKRCLTFGCGLLSNEEADSYVWLLECFMRAFKKQPKIVLSDQDSSMKLAIQKVFNKFVHRFCLWHITSKLQLKVVTELFKDKQFKKNFNALVWNSKLEEAQFEDGWNRFIAKYKLGEIRWFNDMHKIRRSWVPAFFKYIPMSGLMRTTSRSESENSAFQTNTNWSTTLNMFMNAFDNSMEKQRHNQTVLDFNDSQKYPRNASLLSIEDHAATHYTRTVFRQVQNEIKESVISCQQVARKTEGEFDVLRVLEVKSTTNPLENNKSSEDIFEDDYEWDTLPDDFEFEIRVEKTKGEFQCTCMMFEQFGILCRHIFCVFRSYKISQIPTQYLLRRWKRGIIPIEMLTKTYRYGYKDDGIQKAAGEIYSIIDNMLLSMFNNKEKVDEFLQCIKDIQHKFQTGATTGHEVDKRTQIEMLFGITDPIELELQNPSDVHNKGSRKRLRSGKEISIDKTSKEARRCNRCGKHAYHDARNCPTKKKPENQK